MKLKKILIVSALAVTSASLTGSTGIELVRMSEAQSGRPRAISDPLPQKNRSFGLRSLDGNERHPAATELTALKDLANSETIKPTTHQGLYALKTIQPPDSALGFSGKVTVTPEGILAEIDPDLAKSNFQRELAAVQTMKENPNPSLPHILAYSDASSPDLKYEVEFIQGEPLAEYLKENPHREGVMLTQLRDHVGHMQRIGLKNTDINSENFLVNHEGQLVLIDFDQVVPSEGAGFNPQFADLVLDHARNLANGK